MSRIPALAAFALLVVTPQTSSQQLDEVRVSAHVYLPPQLHLTAQSQLVQLEVIVRGPNGEPVPNLKQSDFLIHDEGKPRTIAAFSVESRDGSAAPRLTAAPEPSVTAAGGGGSSPTSSAPPRSVMLFFDDLHASSGELQKTQAAARRFIKEGLGPGGRAAVYASSAGLALNFTPDATALSAAIDKLRSHQRMSENGLQPCPRITPYQAYLIANNLDPLAYNSALAEANQCPDQSIGAGPPAGVMTRGPSKGGGLIPTTPTAINVRLQAETTWAQTREISLSTFDAVENAMALLSRAPGSRVLLLVSTGFISGMLDNERDGAIDRAIHSGIVINALDAKGLWAEGSMRPFGAESQAYKGIPIQTFLFETTSAGSRNDAMNDVMAQFASATGGLFFHSSNDLTGGFAQLAAVPQTVYLLAFHPDPDAAGAYHKLKVQLTAPGHNYVQTRPGYFIPPPPSGVQTEVRQLDQEVLAKSALAGIPIQLAGRLGKSNIGAPMVSLVIHVDLAPLKFAARDGRQIQKLQFVGALIDAHDELIAAKEGSMDLSLKPDTFTRLQAKGVNAELSLTAPPGPYRVRVVVQDADGKMATLSQLLNLPN